jgi:hypothetical protein
MHRKATVIAALGTAVLAVLAVGVLISATRTGSDPEHSPSLVDTTGSPTAPGSVLAGGSTSHAAPSSAARAGADGGAPSGSVAGGDVPVIAAPPVNAAPPVTAAPQTSPQPPSQTRQPPAGGAGGKPEPSGTPTSTQGSPPPSRTHTSSATPPPPSTQPPSSSPTPSPSRTCLLVDPLDRAHCLLPRP